MKVEWSSMGKLILFIGVLFISRSTMAANYYINSQSGSDRNNGTTKESAWKSLKNLESRQFSPGDHILFAKGSRFIGGFVFTSSGTAEKPIVFSTYSTEADVILNTSRSKLSKIFVQRGAGPAPAFSNPDWTVLNGTIFKIEGSYIIIDGLYFHDNTNPPNSNHKNKNVQKMGVIYFALGTNHNVVRNCEFYNTPVSIKVKGTHNLITRNYFHDSTTPMAHSWGPIAIMIVESYNEISFNEIKNYGSYGGPYGSDGGAIELDGVDDNFNGTDINIHHNISVNNIGFLELAARDVENITVAYNLSDDLNQFIGGGSMKNIFVYNNTVIRTREPNVDRNIFWTFYPGDNHFVIENNIFVLGKGIRVFSPSKKPPKGEKRTKERTGIGNQTHDHNIYFSLYENTNPINVKLGKGEVFTDPLFLDYENRNFRLKPNSPAINQGVKLGYKRDLDGYPVPKNGQPDIGAYEF